MSGFLLLNIVDFHPVPCGEIFLLVWSCDVKAKLAPLRNGNKVLLLYLLRRCFTWLAIPG